MGALGPGSGGGAGGLTSPPLPLPLPPTCACPRPPQAWPNGFIHSSQGALQIFTECPPGVRHWDRRRRDPERRIPICPALSGLALGSGQSVATKGCARKASRRERRNPRRLLGGGHSWTWLIFRTAPPNTPFAPVMQNPLGTPTACPSAILAFVPRGTFSLPLPPRVPLPLGTFQDGQR